MKNGSENETGVPAPLISRRTFMLAAAATGGAEIVLKHGGGGDADAGAVGGPIVLPDGTLQEAGSIIWSDGTCVGYGRGRDPGAAEFQFFREVDYCSGAFLLVRQRVVQRLEHRQ